MIKLALFVIVITALVTVVTTHTTSWKESLADLIRFISVYAIATLFLFILSFPLAIFKLFEDNIVEISFALMAIIGQAMAIYGLVTTSRKETIELEEVDGIPTLVEDDFYDYSETIMMNNLSLICVLIEIIVSGRNNIYFVSIYREMNSSFSFYIVVPLYLITCVLIFKRMKKQQVLSSNVITHNDYLASEISPLYSGWKSELGKHMNQYEIPHMVSQFNTTNTDNRLRLTNTEIYKESATMLKLLNQLKWIQSGDNENLPEALNLDLDIDYYTYDSMRAFSENMYKGFKAEEIMMEKIGHLSGLLDNITLEKNGHKVELDAIIINDEGVYLIEVKNYSADTITFESSGMAYRENRNRSERMDILDQVSRARNIIRDIIGPNINIYNVIVFADDDTRIIDNMNHENIRAVHMDLLSFLFQNQTNHNPENKDIENRLLSARASERKYDFYDINRVKADFIQAINKDIKTLSRIVQYSQNFNLVEAETGQIHSDIESKLLEYKFRESDSKKILSFYESKFNKSKEKLKSYLNKLNVTQISSVMTHLENLQKMLT